MTPVTIFVASPGDVAPERKLTREIVDWANRTIAHNHGVHLQAHTYEIDARPRAHPDGPQGPINDDMPVEKHDVVIGILWKRFGTPIPELGGLTGTQYEITRALSKQKGTPPKPEVVVCFSDAPFRPKEADPQQLAQVKAFRDDFRGLALSYDGPTEGNDGFKEKFRDWLIKYLDAHHPVIRRPAGLGEPEGDPSHYIAAIREDTANIEVRGLKVGDTGAWFLPIDQYYIPLTSASRLLTDEVAQHRKLLIVGDPGSGKSTFLRFIANRMCREYVQDGPLPVHLSIAALAKHIAAPHDGKTPAEPDAPEWLLHYLAAHCRDHNRDLTLDYFRHQMRKGRCWILLDGLDETPDGRTRENMARLVTKAAQAYQDCKFIVTSRPEGKVAIAGFEERLIADLPPETVRWYVDKLASHLYPNEPAKAAAFRADLERANTSRAVRRLARNPVMLSALAVLQHNNVRLPERRVDLYESILDWLAKARQKPGRLSAEDCLNRLRELALAMQREPGGRLKRVKLDWSGTKLAKQFDGNWEKARRFLEDEQRDSGIIVSRGDELEFWHLTFQEYLAARAIAGMPDTVQFRELIDSGVIWKPEWRETVLLFVGLLRNQGDAKVKAFLDGILALPVTSLSDRARLVGLVGAMLRDLSGFTLNDRRYEGALSQVMDIFDEKKSESVPFDRRREAAETLGQAGDPRLVERQWVTIPATKGFWMGAQRKNKKGRNYDEEAVDERETVRQVDLAEFRIAKYPVTVGEYAEFMEDGGYAKAEHWTAGGFGETSEPEGWLDQQEHPNRPVMGVNWWEAMAFASWAKHRLPTEEEWERAARGEASAKYPWGNDPVDENRANYKQNVGEPTPVGLYPAGASAEGALDLIGNVWEWTASPHAEGGGSYVCRGGSWINVSRIARSAYRYYFPADGRFVDLGFRLVLGIT